MKIILAEQLRSGASGPERSFDQAIIRVGRDPKDCDIAFDSNTYPMVSRKHAELQWLDGTWFAVDLNSSYGTFVDGQRLAGPYPLTAGSSIQFGESGPVVSVVWFEVVAETAAEPAAASKPFAARTPAPAVSTPVRSVQPVREPIAPAAPAR